MADVVVDQTPNRSSHTIPNDIPEAVKKRAAAVDALYPSPPFGGQASPSRICYPPC